MCEVCHNVEKKLLIQAAACNLALLLRALYGAGKPRAAHDRRGALVFAILCLHSMLNALCQAEFALYCDPGSTSLRPRCLSSRSLHASKRAI